MTSIITLALLALLISSHTSAQEAFKGLPAAKVIDCHSVAAMLKGIAAYLDIATTQCGTTSIRTQTQESFSRLKTLRGEVNVPFYRVNGQYYHNATAHEKLIKDLNAYVSTIPVIAK